LGDCTEESMDDYDLQVCLEVYINNKDNGKVNANIINKNLIERKITLLTNYKRRLQEKLNDKRTEFYDSTEDREKIQKVSHLLELINTYKKCFDISETKNNKDKLPKENNE
jgi:hypothetical protein